MEERMTTIVIPVYNAPQSVKACFHSLVLHTDPSAQVIVINDASDDPLIPALLRDLPSGWVLVENQRNLGFVATANLGMELAMGDDVVLLNSDTEVTSQWLPLLERSLAASDRIASVSPLTNNGEIASIPEICHPNAYPEDPEAWALACRNSVSEEQPWDLYDVPTTIGFCMLMSRSAINSVGYFDEAAFGLGYGEENDWCQRAIDAGWRNILCDRAFVAHKGGESFGPLGLRPNGQNMSRLLDRYPHYLEEVADFISDDPMRQRREAIFAFYESTALSKT